MRQRDRETLIQREKEKNISKIHVCEGVQGFEVTIGARNDFPMTSLRGFDVKPGQKNDVSISATVVISDGLRDLNRADRSCLFSDETDYLRLFKKYSQSNCLLECALNYAQNNNNNNNNNSNSNNSNDINNNICTPWFLPTSDNQSKMCNPWNSRSVLQNMKIDPAQCEYCLPECSSTIYQSKISSQKFKACDDNNLGSSPLCDLTMTGQNPQIWADDVIKTFNSSGQPIPTSLKSR